MTEVCELVVESMSYVYEAIHFQSSAKSQHEPSDPRHVSRQSSCVSLLPPWRSKCRLSNCDHSVHDAIAPRCHVGVTSQLQPNATDCGSVISADAAPVRL